MKLVYHFAIFLAAILLPLIAVFSKKIKLFVSGRKDTFSKITSLKNEKTIWIHAASLGEFEQARPIIEALKKKHKHYKILITFFSPSGYEVRKNYNLADVVCCLPLDSKWNAKKFIATGGGTYTTLNGIYNENIEFFSRDNSKVGLNLEFDYEILIKTDDKKLVSQKNWYHKGFSSKGNPINEIWTQR